MKKGMKLMAGALAAASVFAFGVAGAACKEEKTENVLVVGYTDYEPMNYKDENGVLTGFDTELPISQSFLALPSRR